jgi:hypothetical protein
LVRSIGLSITVGISVVWIRSLGILLCVSQSIIVGVGVAVATVSGIETVIDFPTIGKPVTVRVGIVHVRALCLFFSVGETIAVPVGTTVRRVERIRTIGGNNTCTQSKH